MVVVVVTFVVVIVDIPVTVVVDVGGVCTALRRFDVAIMAYIFSLVQRGCDPFAGRWIDFSHQTDR